LNTNLNLHPSLPLINGPHPSIPPPPISSTPHLTRPDTSASQDDVAFKERQKREAAELKAAAVKAGQKGPLSGGGIKKYVFDRSVLPISSISYLGDLDV